MIRVKMDSKNVNRVLGNAVKYNYGFLEGIDLDQIVFNKKLGEFTVMALQKYIDSQAKMNPNELHHVYEWGQVGKENGRLFKIRSNASKRIITFSGRFYVSKIAGPNTDHVFKKKAEVMESGISVTVSPKNSPVLVFEDDGETVFTTQTVFIEHPGGDAVAGSFGRVIEEFFDQYFTGALLQPLLKDLGVADEYVKYFSQGVKGGGRSAGVRAGKEYMDTSSLGVIE